jgi:hypothetical protein
MGETWEIHKHMQKNLKQVADSEAKRLTSPEWGCV